MKALKLLPKPGVFRFRLSLSVFFVGRGVTLTKPILPVGRQFFKDCRESLGLRFQRLELSQQTFALGLPGRGFEFHPSVPSLKELPSLVRFNLMQAELGGSLLQSALIFSKLQVAAFQLLDAGMMFFFPLNTSRGQPLALRDDPELLIDQAESEGIQSSQVFAKVFLQCDGPGPSGG